MSEVELWLHPDIIYVGVVYAHPKLSTAYLKKVVSYAKIKGSDGGFPNLSWNIWKHMAVNKMQMEEELAWTYFETFHTLLDVSSKTRLELAELQHQSSETTKPNSYKQHMSVPAMQFVLFLFLQQTNKLSLRRSLMGDEWPGVSPRSLDGSLSHKSDTSSNVFNEQKHKQFILTHLMQIFEILSDELKSKDFFHESCVMEAKVVKALSMIIKGRIVGQNTTLSLFEIATRHRVQGKSGFQRSTGCFLVHSFESWLRSSLCDNPYGVTSCTTNGSVLKWSKNSSEVTRKTARVLTNISYAPKGQRIVFFTQCSNQTIARQTDIINGCYVKLHRCNNSNFYLLSPLKLVTIEKCTNATIVLGPVAVAIKILNCSKVTVIAPCRSIAVSGSSEVTLHITTPTRPILSNDNNAANNQPIVFAPYNTYYADLENHLASVGLAISAQIDKWNNPVCIGVSSNGTLNNSKLVNISKGAGDASNAETNQLFKILKPTEFYLFAIPFRTQNLSGDCVTNEIPGGLPSEYAQAVKGKQRATERWKRAVKESSLTKEERKHFQAHVEDLFKKWVVESGNQQQLDDLGKMN